MIVDCHTHVRSFEGTEVSEHLAAAETVDACIVLAAHDGPRDEVNRTAGGVCRSAPGEDDRICGLDPTQDRLTDKALASLTEKLGFKGLVLYCSINGFHPAHSQAMRFYEAVQEVGLPDLFPQRQS